MELEPSNGSVLCDECCGSQRMEDLVTVRCWNNGWGIGLLCRECVAKHTDHVLVPRELLREVAKFVDDNYNADGFKLLSKLREVLGDE